MRLIVAALLLAGCSGSGLSEAQRQEVEQIARRAALNGADDQLGDRMADVESSAEDHEDRILEIEDRLGM